MGEEKSCEKCRGAGEVEAWFVEETTDQMISKRGECEACGGSGKTTAVVAEVVIAGPEDNVENLPAQYRARLARLTGVRRDRYALSRWVAYAGLVFDCFDPQVHVLGDDVLPPSWEKWRGDDGSVYPPPEWPRFRAIDFGYTAPFVCQWWAKSPDRAYYLYREIYMTRRTVRAHAAVMKDLEDRERETIAARWIERERDKADVWEWKRLAGTLKPPRPRFFATYCDHDAEDRATLVECGFPNTPALKDKRPGIDRVWEAMNPFEVAGEKRARIYFYRNALVEQDQALVDAKLPTSTLQEVVGYSYLPKAEGRAAKEDTMPDKDHGCDAMRYAVYTHEVGDVTMRILEVPD
jgi:phage terminase large subunit